ncbi:type I restriction-modification enzyme R subunit C-terminal domain-containing protein [Rhodopseudomonas palustris]|uniref:type I restriction-modification enzyme R subunit C-terminal domain-containing protein n=1 Tax=Rhodopseudomonas palustris TaxID=1076 RepID=UPI002ACEADA2|nr:type I restriction-modification enzyme R subunit C-terminal domain-containing protein [Rhodopseudomonas palustris]WQG99723.1 type I restriction-modification enzyme R subunit C-terminal domain-containing protein [Rhodopseudomonas palustris]
MLTGKELSEEDEEGSAFEAPRADTERLVAGTLADIVMLVRYAIDEAESLDSLPSVIAGRFNLWLGREEKAGRTYTDEQQAWLTAIRDHVGVNIEIRPQDMMDAPEFSGRGGIVRARALFGARLPGLLDELTDAPVA